jgi:hypothetical protein
LSTAQDSTAIFSFRELRGLVEGNLTLKDFTKFLGDPETLNKYLQDYLQKNNGWRFLRDIQFRFKTFTTHGRDSLSSLGFSYDFAKDVNKRYFSQEGVNVLGQAVSVQARGNVAFDAGANPQDFLESGLAVSIFGSHGGAVETSDSVRTLLNRLEDELVTIETEESLNTSAAWMKFFDIAQNHLSTQIYWSVAGTGALESNQKFTTKQYAYGFDASLDVKAWNRNSVLAGLNIFDWPFALVRWLSGTDADFTPLGSTFPTLIAGIKRVVPRDGDPRYAIDSSGAFNRVNLEAAFRTPVGSLLGNEAYFEADFRYFREVNPTPAIVAARLDRQAYFTSALTLADGLFVSYTTGRLPFDAQDDQIYELGFRFKF